MKHLLLAAALLAQGLACAAPPSWEDWDAFKSMSIESGRVVDYSDQRLITTSEGESYALFFALVADDRETFDGLLSWTEKNLAAGDLARRQPAWLWGRRTSEESTAWTILDTNNASDSDMWIAYALLEAGRLWHEPKYTAKAHAMMSLLKKDVRVVKNLGAVLLPGRVGFETADTVKLNPSYAPLFILKRFALEDASWKDVWEGSLRMILRSAPNGFSPDWATFDKEGRLLPPTDEDHVIGSYNAIRTYLWAAMTVQDAAVYATLSRRFLPMVKAAAQLGRPPEKVNLLTGEMNRPGNAGFAGCLLELARQTPGQARNADRLRTVVAATPLERTSYYTNVLLLFARGYDEGRFQFDADGRLVLP